MGIVINHQEHIALMFAATVEWDGFGEHTSQGILDGIKQGVSEGCYPEWMGNVELHQLVPRVTHWKQSGLLKNYGPRRWTEEKRPQIEMRKGLLPQVTPR